jgi:hypothetical protein
MSTPKFAAQDADRILGRLDRVAQTIQTQHKSWGMPFETAKQLVNALDKTADEVELAAFGATSFLRRQAEVIQKDSDEPYMDNYRNPMEPVQIESDEPYMKAYSDDQSSAVQKLVR